MELENMVFGFFLALDIGVVWSAWDVVVLLKRIKR